MKSSLKGEGVNKGLTCYRNFEETDFSYHSLYKDKERERKRERVCVCWVYNDFTFKVLSYKTKSHTLPESMKLVMRQGKVHNDRRSTS